MVRSRARKRAVLYRKSETALIEGGTSSDSCPAIVTFPGLVSWMNELTMTAFLIPPAQPPGSRLNSTGSG